MILINGILRLVLCHEIFEGLLGVLCPQVTVSHIVGFELSGFLFEPVQILIQVLHDLLDFEKLPDFWQIVTDRVRGVESLKLSCSEEDVIHPRAHNISDTLAILHLFDLGIELYRLISKKLQLDVKYRCHFKLLDIDRVYLLVQMAKHGHYCSSESINHNRVQIVLIILPGRRLLVHLDLVEYFLNELVDGLTIILSHL